MEFLVDRLAQANLGDALLAGLVGWAPVGWLGGLFVDAIDRHSLDWPWV